MEWFCVQIGAREHYAVPRALQLRGRLATLYTDFWAGSAIRSAAKIGARIPKLGAVRSLAGRYHPALEARSGKQKMEIVSWNWRALWWEAAARRALNSKNRNEKSPYDGFAEVGRRFAALVQEELKHKGNLGKDSILFAYDTGALEAFEWCREQGIRTVLGQIDPGRVEVNLVQEEEKKWPGWALDSLNVPEHYFRRREQEWALADRVVVNSEWSRQALLRQGVPCQKLVVIPLCYEATSGDKNSSNSGLPTPNSQLQSSSTLRVLYLGQVILRKGIQYLVRAAKLLEKENVRFDIVGPIGISQQAITSAPHNVIFHGRATRDQTASWYGNADVFVLPTLSDGFAITQLEAMSHGLPVIATPCCGEVVTDGRDGFIVPPRDPDALADAIVRYIHRPILLQTQRLAAFEKSRQFTLVRLGANLLALEEEIATGNRR